MRTVATSPLAQERTSTEHLLATAIRATTDFRVRLAERPGVALGDPELASAIRYATTRGFSVRELTAWLRENGVLISPTHVFRKSEHGRGGNNSAEYFVEAFQRFEDAVRWIMGMCKHSADASAIFVNAVLGGPWHEDAAPISSDELLDASPKALRNAAKEAVGNYLDRVKEGKCTLFASDVAHLDVLKHVSQADDAEIRSLLNVAQQIHRRPKASTGVRKLREAVR